MPALSYRDTEIGADLWSLREKQWKLNSGRLYDLGNHAENLVNRWSRPGVVKALEQTKRAMLEERALAGRTTTQPAAETEENLRALGYIVE